MKKYFLNVLPLLVAGVMLAACANGTSYNLINDSFTIATLGYSIRNISFEGDSGMSYNYNTSGVESPSTSVIGFNNVSSGDLVLYTGSISGSIGAFTYELACSKFEGPDEIVLISGGNGLRLTNLQASQSAGTITYSFTIPVSDGDAHMRVELSSS